MSINPYELLGVNQYMSLEEITLEYKRQKSELRELLLREGDEGAQAAKKLQQIKDAYSDIEYIKSTEATIDNRPFGKVEELIKTGEYARAQRILDAQTQRGAEWHYVQAALFYKQGWLTESKLQLELAKAQEPYNEKYSKAYDNLLDVMKNGFPDRVDGRENNRSYPPNTKEMSAGNTCCNICGALLIADCCCDCIGCR